MASSGFSSITLPDPCDSCDNPWDPKAPLPEITKTDWAGTSTALQFVACLVIPSVVYRRPITGFSTLLSATWHSICRNCLRTVGFHRELFGAAPAVLQAVPRTFPSPFVHQSGHKSQFFLCSLSTLSVSVSLAVHISFEIQAAQIWCEWVSFHRRGRRGTEMHWIYFWKVNELFQWSSHGGQKRWNNEGKPGKRLDRPEATMDWRHLQLGRLKFSDHILMYAVGGHSLQLTWCANWRCLYAFQAPVWQENRPRTFFLDFQSLCISVSIGAIIPSSACFNSSFLWHDWHEATFLSGTFSMGMFIREMETLDGVDPNFLDGSEPPGVAQLSERSMPKADEKHRKMAMGNLCPKSSQQVRMQLPTKGPTLRDESVMNFVSFADGICTL